jgi:uncharacterized protein YegL
MAKRPGGEIASRPLHFIWILDCSGSMLAGGKIHALNSAIRDAIPLLATLADRNPEAQVLVRAVKFSKGADWHIKEPTPITELRWEDLQAERERTDMAKALEMVASILRIPPMTQRAMPPALVLASDGSPTDDFEGGLANLLVEFWGNQAVRIPIAIGRDANRRRLAKFGSSSEFGVLSADNPEALVNQIRFASTTAMQIASQPFRPLASASGPSQDSTVRLAPGTRIW